MAAAADGNVNEASSHGPSRPTWILFLLMAAVLIGAVNLGVYIYGLTLPDEWEVHESVIVHATPETIFPLIVSPRRWAEWSVWSTDVDPTLELSYSGAESGPGASFGWAGEQLGRGKLTIADTKLNEQVSYRIELEDKPFSEAGVIRLRLVPAAEGTKVTWSDGGELESTLERLFRKRLEAALSADFARSLNSLKVLAERSVASDDESPLPEQRRPVERSR